MLQTFVPNVLSVFSDVCYKCLSGYCICVHSYVASVLFGCYVCVAMVFKYFMCFFASVSMHISNVLSVFIRILQVLYLDVAYIALAIHIC
jgi:hypothetical protein